MRLNHALALEAWTFSKIVLAYTGAVQLPNHGWSVSAEASNTDGSTRTIFQCGLYAWALGSYYTCIHVTYAIPYP